MSDRVSPLHSLRLWAHGLRRSLNLTEALHADAPRRYSLGPSDNEPMHRLNALSETLYALQVGRLVRAAVSAHWRARRTAQAFTAWRTRWSVRSWEEHFRRQAEAEATGADRSIRTPASFGGVPAWSAADDRDPTGTVSESRDLSPLLGGTTPATAGKALHHR